MEHTISLPALRGNLKMAEDEAERFADPMSISKEEASDGLRYLYQNVLLPLLAEKDVKTSDLDMNRFDLDDITALYNFYEENHSECSSELQKLKRFLSLLGESKPVATVVSFV